MFNEFDYEDTSEENPLYAIEETKRKKRIHADGKLFRSSLNKKKLSKAEMDELFLD